MCPCWLTVEWLVWLLSQAQDDELLLELPCQVLVVQLLMLNDLEYFAFERSILAFIVVCRYYGPIDVNFEPFLGFVLGLGTVRDQTMFLIS